MAKEASRGTKSAQEAIRIRAVKMYLNGTSITKVSEAFQISRQALYKMISKYKEGGLKSLKSNQRGKPKESGRKLTEEQEFEIYRSIIDNCPDQLKFPFVLWTREAIKHLIKDRYNIIIPLRTLSDYLKRWGMTPQKPVKRAYERCEKRVQKWLDNEYPLIEKRAKKEKAEIHWGDETNCQSIPNNLRGFSERGVTPVLKHSAKKFKVNMISSITKLGKMRFMFFDGNFDNKVFIEFLRRLIKDSNHKVFLIIDNLKVHHSLIVKNWVEERKTKIELFFLPPYSPDLNPDEYLNNDLKQNANKNQIPKNLDDLKNNTNSYMRSLQKRPDKIKGFFRHIKTAYAS